MTSFTTKTLAAASGVNAETVRYYERIGLLPSPPRAANGYRRYGEDSVTRLGFIRRARELGFAIEDIRGLLDLAAHAEAPCREADALVQRQLATVQARIHDLQQLANALRALADCRSDAALHCRLLEALQDRDCCNPPHDRSLPAHAAS
ncbi:helix-turn-helix domain-containing protein [Chitiniphilus purpureus]|uniref:Helix-turn-helix domain-containing protein n=1 Tax=Chitiniphilus purpureus TaxID=2981137 RepID=A0ABY6DSA2_9NEIS|nr:helix-turn-helix domain-containing protein [Chitiniphilus sp. CD1]UXY17212.1 helix-turn-helix domain-containing protein [Chitiniphilus sp. CD1]